MLERYAAVKNVREHVIWLARHAESVGDLQRAVQLYQSADDATSLVRLFCVQEDYEAAEAVVNDTGSRAAAFQLARQYENVEDVHRAIRFYTKSGRLSGAIRLAKKHGMGSELLSLSLQTTPLLALEAAEWLEHAGQYEHAVTLYQKFGRRAKALSLCFEKELFESLRAMADELGTDDDPVLLQRCANFFTSHGQVRTGSPGGAGVPSMSPGELLSCRDDDETATVADAPCARAAPPPAVRAHAVREGRAPVHQREGVRGGARAVRGARGVDRRGDGREDDAREGRDGGRRAGRAPAEDRQGVQGAGRFPDCLQEVHAGRGAAPRDEGLFAPVPPLPLPRQRVPPRSVAD